MFLNKNLTLVALSLVTAGLALSALAEDKKPAAAPAAAATEEVKLESKVSENAHACCMGACRINYPKELGLNLAYLDDIGTRIHKARKAPDPVDLALAAQALDVAEKVAGKKASITAAQVLADAIELAKLRGDSTELSAVSMIVSDKAAQKELAAMAEAAKTAEAESRAATENGEASKELIGTLRVINHTHECLNIYVDGHYVGECHEGETENFHVHAHGCQNHFDAYCVEGGELVRHADYHGHSHFLSWHIH